MPNFLQRAKALGMQRNKGDIDALLAGVFNAEAFSQSRSLLEEMRAPAARRRSMLRDPDKCLSAILERWHAPSP